MNLLFADDLKDEFDIGMLINSVSESNFVKFLKEIDSKKNWIEELCSCYAEYDESGEIHYRLETFEGETFYLSYRQVV